MIINEILFKRYRWKTKREITLVSYFYYFSFASSCKREIDFIQGKLRVRPAVIKNTIETYLAGEPVFATCE